MPEWTVQKVRWLSRVPYAENSYQGSHCIECSGEMWSDFDLDYKYVIARINSILDNGGKIISTIGEDIILHCKKMNLRHSIMSDYGIGEAYFDYQLLIFSKEFVKKYGLRTGECVDLVLTGISSQSNKIEIKEEIYPKTFHYWTN